MPPLEKLVSVSQCVSESYFSNSSYFGHQTGLQDQEIHHIVGNDLAVLAVTVMIFFIITLWGIFFLLVTELGCDVPHQKTLIIINACDITNQFFTFCILWQVLS
ncbi:hypothetical protein CARUB_v10028343mg [Capsella rubella]|uniref:Uncharacterized protein n=1 Tax=Capsella rubella TaxID=81985 RepID=R0GE83_9BRAS|nr:hypothetical protein CARUB_v10028343mg [Capsella rubella]